MRGVAGEFRIALLRRRGIGLRRFRRLPRHFRRHPRPFGRVLRHRPLRRVGDARRVLGEYHAPCRIGHFLDSPFCEAAADLPGRAALKA